MPFVEVFTRQGSVNKDQQNKISEQLVAEVMRGEGAPDTAAARSISWLVWQEIQHWSIGGRPATADEPPRYIVRISVPTKSLTDDKRKDIVSRVTRVLAEADSDPDRLYREPSAWVQLIEIGDGNWGAAGRVWTFADVKGFVTAGAPV